MLGDIGCVLVFFYDFLFWIAHKCVRGCPYARRPDCAIKVSCYLVNNQDFRCLEKLGDSFV